MSIQIDELTQHIIAGPGVMELVNAWLYCNRKTPGGEQQFFVTFTTSGNHKHPVVVYDLRKEDGSGDKFIFVGTHMGTGDEVEGYYDLSQSFNNHTQRGHIKLHGAEFVFTPKRREVVLP